MVSPGPVDGIGADVGTGVVVSPAAFVGEEVDPACPTEIFCEQDDGVLVLPLPSVNVALAVKDPAWAYSWAIGTLTALVPIPPPVVTSWTLPSPKLKVTFAIVLAAEFPTAVKLIVAGTAAGAVVSAASDVHVGPVPPPPPPPPVVGTGVSVGVPPPPPPVGVGVPWVVTIMNADCAPDRILSLGLSPAAIDNAFEPEKEISAPLVFGSVAVCAIKKIVAIGCWALTVLFGGIPRDTFSVQVWDAHVVLGSVKGMMFAPFTCPNFIPVLLLSAVFWSTNVLGKVIDKSTNATELALDPCPGSILMSNWKLSPTLTVFVEGIKLSCVAGDALLRDVVWDLTKYKVIGMVIRITRRKPNRSRFFISKYIHECGTLYARGDTRACQARESAICYRVLTTMNVFWYKFSSRNTRVIFDHVTATGCPVQKHI